MFRKRPIWILLAMLACGCRQDPPGPVEIEPYDVCSLCKMAISEKRFAAEMIDTDGAVHKFDDLRCFLTFRRQRRPRIAAAYVMDYERQNWIDAAWAHYVRSNAFHTPMGGGIVALADRAAAERQARLHRTKALRLAELGEN